MFFFLLTTDKLCLHNKRYATDRKLTFFNHYGYELYMVYFTEEDLRREYLVMKEHEYQARGEKYRNEFNEAAKEFVRVLLGGDLQSLENFM